MKMITTFQRIKKVRKARRLTQEAFADKLGINPGHASKIERGVANPSEQLINSICKHFNVKKEWLLEGKSDLSVEDGLTPGEIDDFEANSEEQSRLGLINYLSGSSDIIKGMTDWVIDAQFALDKIGKPDEKLLGAKQDLLENLDWFKEEISRLFDFMEGKKKPAWEIRNDKSNKK